MFNSTAPDKSRQGNLTADETEEPDDDHDDKKLPTSTITDDKKDDGETETQNDFYDLTDVDEKAIAEMEEKMRNRRIINSNKKKECVDFKFSVYVLGISNVDSTSQSYRCRFEVSCFTQMTRKQKMEYIKDPGHYEPDDIMQVYSLNTVELLERKMMTFHNNKNFIVYYDEDFKSLSIANIWWINAKISEDFELQNFPFDVQHLEIPITFEFRDQNYMRNYRHRLMPEYCLFMIMDGVDNMNGFNMDTPHLEFKCIGYDNFPPKYAFLRFTVQREWKFYVSRVMCALAIISFLTNLAFIFGDIEAHGVADRYGYISTMFLSAVAYLFIITSYLPILKYFTFLDKYTFMTFLYILLIAIENWIVNYYHEVRIGTISLNSFLFVGNYIVWGLVHVWFIWAGGKAWQFEMAKQGMIKEEVDAGQQHVSAKVNATGPIAIFGREKGYQEIKDFNGAKVYYSTQFHLGYDDLPHVRYGHS